jgi:hypothetical protein
LIELLFSSWGPKYFVLGVLIGLLFLSQSHAQTIKKTPDVTIKSTGPIAVAYLVNGFTGCCIPKKVRDFLVSKHVKVHESNWNDIDKQGDPGGDVDPRDGRVIGAKPYTDENFIQQMQVAIKEIDATNPSTPLILIGHSFGGDALLQVVKRIAPRRIAFLAVLDAVGKGGLRKNVTSPVSSNVDYFFNRWQENPPFAGDHMIPFDRLLSGNLKSNAHENNQGKQNTEKSSNCKTKYRDPLKAIPNLLKHGEVPNDGCIQQKIIDILSDRLFR